MFHSSYYVLNHYHLTKRTRTPSLLHMFLSLLPLNSTKLKGSFMAPEQTGHKFQSPCTLQYLPRTYSIWVALLWKADNTFLSSFRRQNIKKKILEETVGYCPISSSASKVSSVVVSLLKWKIVHSLAVCSGAFPILFLVTGLWILG